MKTLGIIGWRGLVGSTLIDRMREENDFCKFEPYFFSTSQAGEPAPRESRSQTLLDAYDIKKLAQMDILLSCQGSEYTRKIYEKLRSFSWQGIWVDASSFLRMRETSTLLLDPINGKEIKQALENRCKDFIGANCTVSLMLMAIASLIKIDLVEWVNSMTYQAISGAGAGAMKELIEQMHLFKKYETSHQDMPQEFIGSVLAGNLLPWIDSSAEYGQSREEWKGTFEARKLLGNNSLLIDGTCVRVPVLRCHSQALVIKLKKDLPISEIEEIIKHSHPWVKLIPNHRESTLKELNPMAVSESLNIYVGRLRKLRQGGSYLNAFTTGDQLLWGAAEPLRRFLINYLCDI